MPKQSPNKDQVAKFKQAARELGCDEDEASFEARLRKIAKTIPPQTNKTQLEKKKPRPK
jgi:hypothetical protein